MSGRTKKHVSANVYYLNLIMVNICLLNQKHGNTKIMWLRTETKHGLGCLPPKMHM